MKTATATAIVQIEAKELAAFEPVNETLATNFIFTTTIKKKSFGVVDLWKCRQQRRLHGITIR